MSDLVVLAQAVDEAKRRGITLELGRYDHFKERYFNDPAGFVRDCIEWKRVPGHDGLYPYQAEILDAAKEHHRISVRGPHGLGKTALMALLFWWFALTRDGLDWKIATTASAWRQLTKFLWPEIHKWARYINWGMIGRSVPSKLTELHVQNLKLSTGEGFAMASNDETLIEGAHADHLLYLFDESKSIIPAIFHAVEGAFSTTAEDMYWFVFSTPGDVSGEFYEIHQKRRTGWWTRHVTLEETIDAGAVSADWAAARKHDWGDTSSIYQNRVEGQFAEASEDAIIPLSWVEAAVERWKEFMDDPAHELPAQSHIGVDVARYGDDKSVIAPRRGRLVMTLKKYGKLDTMEFTGHVTTVLREGGQAMVDVIGVGAGVFDRLREQKLSVGAFNAANSTSVKDRSGKLEFLNKRAAAWWNMRELLDPDNNEYLMLPDDDDLIGDLTAPKWTTTSNGKIKVEAKEDIKTRISHSPDCGDAVVMAFWEHDGPLTGRLFY